MGAYATVLAALQRALRGGADGVGLQPDAGVEAALHARLALLPFEPRRLLDLSGGARDGARALARRWPHAEVVAVALTAPPAARAHWPWRRRVARVRAAAGRLPFRDGSVDLVCANLLRQHHPELDATFAEVRRVLRVGGCFSFSALGATTLAELRAARAAAGEHATHAPFPDLLELGDALLHAGFKDPVIDADRHTLTYADLSSLLRDLRQLGGRTAARAPGLGGRGRLRQLALAYEPSRGADGRLPATFEVLYGRAWNPAAAGMPAEVTIAPASIGRRRR